MNDGIGMMRVSSRTPTHQARFFTPLLFALTAKNIHHKKTQFTDLFQDRQQTHRAAEYYVEGFYSVSCHVFPTRIAPHLPIHYQ
jgi:fermentation-respiration switch protein FrsA (DUF1100 family)